MHSVTPPKTQPLAVPVTAALSAPPVEVVAAADVVDLADDVVLDESVVEPLCDAAVVVVATRLLSP